MPDAKHARYRLPGRDLDSSTRGHDTRWLGVFLKGGWCLPFYHRIHHHSGNMFRLSKHQTKLFHHFFWNWNFKLTFTDSFHPWHQCFFWQLPDHECFRFLRLTWDLILWEVWKDAKLVAILKKQRVWVNVLQFISCRILISCSITLITL